MKQDKLYWWCDQIWLYVLYAIGILLSCGLIINWSTLSVPTKLIMLLAIIHPIHVFEENTFPGRFFYMNNLNYKTEDPMAYPQSMLTNMFTNLGGEIPFLILIVFANRITVPVLILVTVFGFGQCIFHTTAGIRMYYRFRDQGKTTIYGPGLITCYVGYIQLSSYALHYLFGIGVTASGVIGGVVLSIAIMMGFVGIPLQISSRMKSKRFRFKNSGYFEKFNR